MSTKPNNISPEALELLSKTEPAVFEGIIKSFGFKIEGRTKQDPLQTESRIESIKSIASILTENINTLKEISPTAAKIKKIAEKAGYILSINPKR